MKRVVLMALGVLLALALASPMALAQVEQRAQASGTSEELVTAWWQWALSKPANSNPLFGGDPNYSDKQCDGTPLSGTSTKTWFLAGTFDGSAVERTCTVPPDRQIFFPVLNVATIADPGETEESLLAQAHAYLDAVLADPDFSMIVTVDGTQLQDASIVRADAGLFTGTSPLLHGKYTAVADGFWVTLPPLSAGEHTIHWEVSAPNVDTDPNTTGVEGFFQDNTYHLTVVQGKPAQ
jgi:hypothetical protein